MDSNKSWYSIELIRRHAEIFKKYLRNAEIHYEPSEAGLAIHFECYMTAEEYESASEFLHEMNRLLG